MGADRRRARRPSAERHAPRQLVEMSGDVRSAVLLDPAGGLIASSEDDAGRARKLAGLAHELIVTADSAANEPTEQIEVHAERGGVFAVRSARYTLACVVRRLALPALVLYDLRRTLIELESAA